MDLIDYEGEEVLISLRKIAQDPNEDMVLSATCGESLGILLSKKSKLEWNYLRLIRPIAYDEAYAVIKNRRPEWIEELLKDKE